MTIKKKRILLAFGTRPEAIKMAPLYLELKKNPDYFDTSICVSAQHRDMLDQVLHGFNIKPDFDLNVMKPSQDLFDITSSILLGMRDVLRVCRPDYLLVHGDTTTALASSIAAFYENIKIGHIEAGLRTSNILKPFPEEFNRQVVSKITSIHFAPTSQSKKNLLEEKIKESSIKVVGNTVVDALYLTINQLETDLEKKNKIVSFLNSLLRFDWTAKIFILITGHRRENFGEGLQEICNALKRLSLDYPNIQFIYPVHLNPNVQKPVLNSLSGIKNFHLIPPLDYEPFIYLLKHSYFVLTDSGGIQEEAPSLNIPVLVMRNETERPEALESGAVKLVGSSASSIVAHVKKLLEDKNFYDIMARSKNPYGDGTSSKKIVDELIKANS
jgi:UDP-N-acetylglucosamine 2-epimerase (non-hydrolysing)